MYTIFHLSNWFDFEQKVFDKFNDVLLLQFVQQKEE